MFPALKNLVSTDSGIVAVANVDDLLVVNSAPVNPDGFFHGSPLEIVTDVFDVVEPTQPPGVAILLQVRKDAMLLIAGDRALKGAGGEGAGERPSQGSDTQASDCHHFPSE
jgi:hypothetical protein